MSLVMLIHVLTGTTAVLGGGTALFAAKGSRIHRIAGNVFFISMLSTCIAGTAIALRKPEMITFLAGIFCCYLVTTSWVTVTRDAARTGLLNVAALLLGIAIAGAGIVFGWEALNSASGVKDGYPPEPYFVFGGLAAFAAFLDGSVLFRGAITGAHRLARHLWRMCVALFIAAGSLFTGPGAGAFPESLQGTWLMSMPELIAILVMFFWLGRVLFTRWAQTS